MAFARQYSKALRILMRRMSFVERRGYDEIPELKEKVCPEGRSIFIADAVVGLGDKEDYAHPWMMIVKECCSYGGAVYFETPRTNKKRVLGNSTMGMLTLGLIPGSLVDIIVGETSLEKARKEALRIYAGITTQGERPDFERLGIKEKPTAPTE